MCGRDVRFDIQPSGSVISKLRSWKEKQLWMPSSSSFRKNIFCRWRRHRPIKFPFSHENWNMCQRKSNNNNSNNKEKQQQMLWPRDYLQLPNFERSDSANWHVLPSFWESRNHCLPLIFIAPSSSSLQPHTLPLERCIIKQSRPFRQFFYLNLLILPTNRYSLHYRDHNGCTPIVRKVGLHVKQIVLKNIIYL